MNIFRLDDCPTRSAQLQCDKHVVKMIVESAQMLSTAHRLIDGRKIGKLWVHPHLDDVLYKASHVNHPCNIWVREGVENYHWLSKHFEALCKEYTHRYGKIHATWRRLGGPLFSTPSKLPQGSTPFRMAVGEHPWKGSIVETYRSFYCTKQERMSMVWSKREIPEWFNGYLIAA